ncbi:hypothetical protein AGMMS49938_01670 [Fibrobacterales bacterium]|nr:hypothetical protein AGMMS49938_01670 [Fibrobacterales bacterium]
MQPQFFSWLFDDRVAWEKSLSDPRYTYELPIDCFMTLYGFERRAQNNDVGFAIPSFAPSMPSVASIPLTPAPAFSAAPVFAAATLQVEPVSAPSQKEEKKADDGILSQDEIDALLSGL